jgi:hypothetical protein
MAKRRAESREDLVITSVALARDLHRRLAIASVEENAAIAQIVRELIEQYLAGREQTTRRGKPR